MLVVTKRNGNTVTFDKDKIIKAINAAMIDVDGQLYEEDTAIDIANDIEAAMIRKNIENISVEEIQNQVEDYLMQSERRDVAREYIRYRYKQEVARETRSDFIDAIGEKLEARNVQNQNANVDEHSFGGRIGEASSVMTKQYALDYIVSKMARENHLNNEIYIHDLDSYAVGMHNCLSIPFDDLLAKGFNTRQTDVRPANSINTAFQLVAVIFQLQSLQQFGGVSATHIDWTMVPYVRKSFYKYWKEFFEYYTDGYPFVEERKGYLEFLPTPQTAINDKDKYLNMGEDNPAYKYALSKTEKEIYQAVEGLYHNLNTLQSRSGNQLKRMAG